MESSTARLLLQCVAAVITIVVLRTHFAPKHRAGPAAASSACALRDTLQRRIATEAHHSIPHSTNEISLYFWFRWHGSRRAHHPNRHSTIACAGGLRCVLNSTDAAFPHADAVVIWVGARPERRCLPPKLPGQPWAVEYTESPAYYPELWDAAFMRQFSLKVSYEHDSDVVLTAVHPLVEGGIVPPARWVHARPRDARTAVVWLASNCDSKNRREALVRRLGAALPPTLPLHSVGRCLHNHDADELQPKAGAWTDGDDASLRSKLALLGGYAFSLVLENSIAADYVTEKLFHAFAAGCVPVYYGTRDVSKVLPHARAAVQVLDHPDAVARARARDDRRDARRAASAPRVRDDAAAVDAWWAAAQRHRRGDDGDDAAALLLRLRGGALGARARPRQAAAAVAAAAEQRVGGALVLVG